MLTDKSLALLVDEDFTSLDVSYARRLSHSGISTALQGLPLLRALDVSHTAFQPALLTELGHFCPQLEVLRLAGLPPKPARAAAAALLRSLPQLQQTDVADSWEEFADATASQVARPVQTP